MRIKSLAKASVCLAPLFVGSQAFAQADQSDFDGLEPIIVTASKSGERQLQKTPIAVSVINNALLEDQGLSNVKDIATYAPNVAVSRNIAGSIVSIRGIGSNGGDPSVTTQVDGVYIAGSIAFMEFFDLERVEVLRGPQGTLYGRNATGGTINFISRKPSTEGEGQVRLTYGNYDRREASAYLSGPLAGDELTASLAVSYQQHDAFFNNIVPGGRDVGSGKNGGARAQFRWQPSDDFTATTRVDYAEVDQIIESYDHLLLAPAFAAPLAASLVGSYRDVAVNGEQSFRLWNGGISEDINWQLSDEVELASITAWRHLKSRAFNDNDATELNLLYFRSSADTRQFSQEFNLKYNTDRLKSVIGLYYYDDTAKPGSRVVQPPSITTPANRSALRDVRPTQKTRSWALFSQGEYEIAPDLNLVLGARYTSEKNSFDQNFQATSLNPATPGANLAGFPAIFSIDSKDKAFTPKFGVNYQASSDVFLYASATRGFKSGGFNGQGTSSTTSGFDPEFIWSYEVGAKTEWLDRRLRVNATGFYYDYTDLQVRQLLGPGNSVIANAASATVKGIELEVVARPTPEFQLTASGSYLDARYDRFPTASIPGAFATFVPNQNCVGGVCTVDGSGNDLSDAPHWSGMVAIDYTPDLDGYDVSFHMDYAWRSKRYFDVSNIALASQDAYGLVNANIGFAPAEVPWKLELFGRNLTDEKYYQTVSGNGLVPGAIVGDPRTYGVRISYAW